MSRVTVLGVMVCSLFLVLLGQADPAAAGCPDFGCQVSGSSSNPGFVVSNSGNPGHGIIGLSNMGYGVIGEVGEVGDGGVKGLCMRKWGYGVHGEGDTGVFGRAIIDGGHGVEGFVSGLAGDNGVGVLGYANSGGTGVRGVSDQGIAGSFWISQADNAMPALKSVTEGTGAAGEFVIANPDNTTYALVAGNDNGKGVYGTGKDTGVYGTSSDGFAGIFEITEASNINFALMGKNLNGAGIFGAGKSTGVYGSSDTIGYGVQGASSSGTGGYFRNSSATTTKSALKAQTAGTGWAGEFRGTGLASRGVYIKTAGGQGLLVQGGTKSAVVETSRGKRALYAEEASEVYFTDYGFGRLKDGKAVIPIDPLFAETVNLRQPYHVFTQAYGHAELVVTKRTPTAFEVCLRDKDTQGDAHAEFSYRLVAKRQGFETARLEATPSPDDGPGLNADKPLEKVAALSRP